MALSQSTTPSLKAFRSYSEHDVINGLYSATVVPTYAGTFLTIASAGGNPNVNLTGTGLTAVTPFIGNLGAWGEPPAYAESVRFGIANSKVRAANSGDVVIGMNLVTCSEEDKYGVNYAYSPRSAREENQHILSGEGLKILTRGLVSTNGYVGTPAANSGAFCSGGLLIPCAYNKTLFPQLVGKFLEGADNDGYALFKIEL